MIISDQQTIHKVTDLSKHLFWDVDMASIDIIEDDQFIISRILENGVLSDWKIALDTYGLSHVNEVTKNIRSLNMVSVHFMAFLTSTPLNQYRCFVERQSNLTLWNS